MKKLDTNKRWVRVHNRTENGFVEFDFFVSDADLFVELILPEAAFAEFCANNKVIVEDNEKPVFEGNKQPSGMLKLVN